MPSHNMSYSKFKAQAHDSNIIHCFIDDYRLTIEEFLILRVLASANNTELTSESVIMVSSIAKRTRIKSDNTVAKYLKSLMEKGFIILTGRSLVTPHGCSNVYMFTARTIQEFAKFKDEMRRYN